MDRIDFFSKHNILMLLTKCVVVDTSQMITTILGGGGFLGKNAVIETQDCRDSKTFH